MRSSLFHFLLCLFLAHSLFCQEQLGIRSSRYAGVHALVLNPATGFNYPNKSDFNLIGIGLSLENSYAFIEDFALLKLNSNTSFIARPDLSPTSNLDDDVVVTDFYADKNSYWFSGQVEAMLPSMLYIHNEKWAFGLINRIRIIGGSFDIPKQLGYYEFQSTPENVPFDLDKTSLVGAGWLEIGANAAYSWPTSYGYANVGFTIKYLAGLEGFLVENNQKLSISKLDDNRNIISISNLDVDIAYASSLVNDEAVSQNGRGWAIDLGMEWEIESNREDLPYDYRIGIALLDWGKINFDNQVAYHRFEADNPGNLDLDTLKNFDEITLLDDAIEVITTQLLGENQDSRVDRELNLYMPSALSIHLDKCISNHWYANAVLVQRISRGNGSIRRNSLVGLVPRYERRHYSIALPISFIEWSQLRIGFAARLGILSLGTEDLFGLMFSKSELTGANAYLALKFSPFHWNSEKAVKNGSKNKGRPVPCPDF